MNKSIPTTSQRLIGYRDIVIPLACATAATLIFSAALWISPTFHSVVQHRWGMFDRELLAIDFVFITVFVLTLSLRVIPRWAARPELTRTASSRTIAIVCGVALFGEHWVQGRLASYTAPLNMYLWSAAIAVGATPLVDRLARKSTIIGRNDGLAVAWLVAMACQFGAQFSWQAGLAAVTRPLASMTAVEKAIGAAQFVGPPLFIGLIVWAVFGRSTTTPRNPAGIVCETTRSGYPMLTWSQIVGTSETIANFDTRQRFELYLYVIAISALVGLSSGLEGMVGGALLAAWLGGLTLRGAGKFVMQGQTLGFAEHAKTETDRREEVTPMTRQEDCQAYVEEEGGVLWFCIARGDSSEGALPLVERVPLDSFGNFEEGSHKTWFRSRGSVNDVVDWGVIIAQSSVGRIVRVAESVHNHAWLIELLVKLQNTFVGRRDSMLRELQERELTQRVHDNQTGIESHGEFKNATPTRPF